MPDSSSGQLVLPNGPGSLRSRVAMALRAAIRSGVLVPGTVYSVPVLAGRFGVSATPVREAMLDMVNDGLVESVPNRGFRVVAVSAAELRHVAEVRLRLEPVAIADLAGRLTALELEGLRAKIDAIGEAAERDHEAAAQAAWVFRDVLLSLCPNPVLVETISWLRDRSRPSDGGSAVDYAKFARNQYALVDDLAAGNADKVRRTVEFDITRHSPARRVTSQA